MNSVPTKDSKYMVHLQVEVRNAQNQLISVSETTHVHYIPNEITDNIFNEKLGKKEIIVLDDIKYEKVRYTALLDTKQLLDDKNVIYKEIDIEKNDMSREDLYDVTGGRTVPQIIINEKVIGGYSQLFSLNQSGELDKLLRVKD